MFAAMNIMRPAVIEKYKLDDFEFSLSYMSFWDKLEKANFFLETMIDCAIAIPRTANTTTSSRIRFRTADGGVTPSR